MIKSFIHTQEQAISGQRDKEINEFILEHGSWALQTNTMKRNDYEIMITTVFYGKKW